MNRFGSRKFLLTLIVLLLLSLLPVFFKHNLVGDAVAMMALGGIIGVGVAYGFINIKDVPFNPAQDIQKIEAKVESTLEVKS